MISTNWPNGQLGLWIHALIGGAQPFHGWWAPVTQHHKKGGGGQGTRHEVHLSRQTPHLQSLNPNRSKRGAASEGKTATRHRRLCTAATATTLSPSVFTAPPSSNPMASSSSTKAIDGLHLLNPYLSLTLSVNLVSSRIYISSNVSFVC